MIRIMKSDIPADRGGGWKVHILGASSNLSFFKTVTSACDFVWQRMAIDTQWWLWKVDDGFVLTSKHDQLQVLQPITEKGECIAVDRAPKIYHLLKSYLMMEQTT